MSFGGVVTLLVVACGPLLGLYTIITSQSTTLELAQGTVHVHTHNRSITWHLNTTVETLYIEYLWGRWSLGILELCDGTCPSYGVLDTNYDGRSLYYEILDIHTAPGRYRASVFYRGINS